MSALRDHAHLLFPTQEPCACQSRAHAPWQQTAVNHPRTAAPVLVVQRHRLEGGGGGGNGVPGTVVVGIDCNKHRRRHKRGAGGDHQGERLLCSSAQWHWCLSLGLSHQAIHPSTATTRCGCKNLFRASGRSRRWLLEKHLQGQSNNACNAFTANCRQ